MTPRPRGAVAGIALAPGRAAGEALVLTEPLSFWGGLDPVSGLIIDQWHPARGACVTGRILVMSAGRGSSSGSSVLAEAIRLGTGPSGIVLLKRDGIVTVGAMVAAELYGKPCPVLLAAPADWPRIVVAQNLTLVAEANQASIEFG